MPSQVQEVLSGLVQYFVFKCDCFQVRHMQCTPFLILLLKLFCMFLLLAHDTKNSMLKSPEYITLYGKGAFVGMVNLRILP